MVLVSSKSECCSSWKNCKRSFSVLFRSMPKISSLVIFVFTPPIRYRPSSSSPRTSMISMHLRANAKPTSSSRYSSLFLDLPGAKYVYRKIVCTHTHKKFGISLEQVQKPHKNKHEKKEWNCLLTGSLPSMALSQAFRSSSLNAWNVNVIPGFCSNVKSKQNRFSKSDARRVHVVNVRVSGGCSVRPDIWL